MRTSARLTPALGLQSAATPATPKQLAMNTTTTASQALVKNFVENFVGNFVEFASGTRTSVRSTPRSDLRHDVGTERVRLLLRAEVRAPLKGCSNPLRALPLLL